MFRTQESLPFEVRYLTAADELSFFGNTNTFLLDIELGEDITHLTQLRRLTIGSYGLISLPDSFVNMQGLEYLNLCANNFQSVPAILSKENFPNLRSLVLNANQRRVVYDLSNTTKTNIGGFSDEKEFPKRLLMWDNLDTLILSVNYLQGELPDLMDDPDFPKWTKEDINSCDTLPEILIGTPKSCHVQSSFQSTLTVCRAMLLCGCSITRCWIGGHLIALYSRRRVVLPMEHSLVLITSLLHCEITTTSIM
jgi:hypothetical protein